MSAQPAVEHDPDDPVAILRALPGHYHQQFLAAYRAAAEAAREPGSYQALQALLRLWSLLTGMWPPLARGSTRPA